MSGQNTTRRFVTDSQRTEKCDETSSLVGIFQSARRQLGSGHLWKREQRHVPELIRLAPRIHRKSVRFSHVLNVPPSNDSIMSVIIGAVFRPEGSSRAAVPRRPTPTQRAPARSHFAPARSHFAHRREATSRCGYQLISANYQLISADSEGEQRGSRERLRPRRSTAERDVTLGL